MIDMHKELRAELRGLKKQDRALVRETGTAAVNRRKAIARAERVLHQECAAARLKFNAASKTIERENLVLQKALYKRGRAIAERRAIVEGRLS